MDLVQYGTGSAARLLAARNKNTINNNEFTLLLALTTSAANRLIGEVVQSRRRPLLAPTSAFTFKTLLRHYAKRALTPR